MEENEFIQLIVKGKGRENFENYLINNFNKDGRIYEVATDSGTDSDVGYRFDAQKDLLTEKNLTKKGFVKHKILNIHGEERNFYYNKETGIAVYETYFTDGSMKYTIAPKNSWTGAIKKVLEKLKSKDLRGINEMYNNTIDLYEELSDSKNDYLRITDQDLKGTSPKKKTIDLFIFKREEGDPDTFKKFLKDSIYEGNYVADAKINLDDSTYTYSFDVEEDLLKEDYLLNKGFRKSKAINMSKEVIDLYHKGNYVIMHTKGGYTMLNKETMVSSLNDALRELVRNKKLSNNEKKIFNDTVDLFEKFGGQKNKYKKFKIGKSKGTKFEIPSVLKKIFK